MATERDDAARDFVEELGLLVESSGWMPRIAGRALGWLLLAPEPQSQADLREALQASAAAISTASRLLVAEGLVQKVSVPGRRQTYMKVPPDVWQVMETEGLRVVRRYRALAEGTLTALGAGNSTAEENLARMSTYFGIVETRIQAVLAQLGEQLAGEPGPKAP
ncbi:hypothetical protein GCM10017673_20110 [Streptosporangium violaceochromogenes]|nr:hypothetical protein GCM10017673_20110 [Streptosporangium violaceochromogenes]